LHFQLRYLRDSKWPHWLPLHSWAVRVTEITSPLRRVMTIFNVSTGARYSVQQLSPTVGLDVTRHGFHVIPEKVVQRRKIWLSRWPSNWTISANPTVWKVYSEMHSPACKNEVVRHLAAVASVAWLAEGHLPTYVGNGSSANPASMAPRSFCCTFAAFSVNPTRSR
jgi:hypothetical protein